MENIWGVCGFDIPLFGEAGEARQGKANRLDFVADRYPAISIKNSERSKRAAQGIQRVHILNKDQNIPKQWKKYLSSGENKESLIAFLCDHWRSYISSSLSHLDCIYVTRKEKCLLITSGTTQTEHVSTREVPQLECDHEEADTILLLHYKAAALSHQRIIIKSPDTDVFVLCIAMQKTIGKELLMMTGTGNKFRLIDISSILNVLDEELCACLPGFHAFSGCDSTSAFLGKGKVKPWKALQMNPRFVEIFSQLGRSAEVSDELVVSLGTFVCLLYGDQTSTCVDECRYQLFKSGKYSDDVLPPDSDSLRQRIKRANFQALAWNRCKDCHNGQDEEHNLEEIDGQFPYLNSTECDPETDGDISDDEC
ncbi:Hypothetical predicted protein [Paramuricea clavata]|uniref:Uncharacterized protein n=1 Tax=Paramuricea clavata TaxID=317549 RepID=A0A7D9DSV0_PARCT|nr:Hypothetical predicted protein [Paramuricea clavata]